MLKLNTLSNKVLLVLVVSLLIPIFASHYEEITEGQEKASLQAAENAKNSLKILSLGVVDHLWNFNSDGANSLVLAVLENENIASVKVIDSNGKDFLSEKNIKATLNRSSEVEEKVLREGEVIGKIKMTVSYDAIDNELQEIILDAIKDGILEFLFSTIAIFLVLKFLVVRPIEKITLQAKMLDGNSWGSQIDWKGRGDEIGILGSSLNVAQNKLKNLFSEIEMRKKDLEIANKNLDEKVQVRTREIKQILDHVKTGFFRVNAQGLILPGYTKSCQTIFGELFSADLNSTDFLFRATKQNREKESFLFLLEQVFDDVLPDEVSLSQLPRKFHFSNTVVSVEGSVIRNNENKIECVLFTAQDITLLNTAEELNHNNSAILEILRHRNAFSSFVAESYLALQRASQYVVDGLQSKVRGEIHTIKGNALSFGLHSLGSFIHDVENAPSIMQNHIEEISEQFSSFLSNNYALLKLQFAIQEQRIVTIDSNSALEFQSLIGPEENSQSSTSLEPHKTLEAIRNWWAKQFVSPIVQLMGPLEKSCAAICEKLGKSVSLEISGADLNVIPERTQGALQALIHAVRNSIDHGIESPELRGHKSREGHIQILFQPSRSEPTTLSIQFSDDGSGVNIENVKQKALSIGYVAKEEAVNFTEKDWLDSLFSGKLSTAKAISEVSGRGVGMAALKNAVELAGGVLIVKNSPGKGFFMEIEIPKALLLT